MSPLIDRLDALVPQLDEGQLHLLVEMAEAMCTSIEQTTSSSSDIADTRFCSNFANRLRLHHATTEERFKKKSFEYAFREASLAAGRLARMEPNPSFPGADVTVDGEAFSLKTEASASLNLNKITISKLMEARWIRECRTGVDFSRGVHRSVLDHIQGYQRILTLRASTVEGNRVRYDLVEIPVAILAAVQGLRPEDFTPRTRSGGSSARVQFRGRHVFTLRLDGSVEKVTVSGLPLDVCHHHARWVMPDFDPSN